jgi:hypothetical protein
MLEKIGAAEINGFLIKAASKLREQDAEILDLKNKLAARERLDHAEKIAHTAVERGAMAPDDAAEYARSLADSDKDLNMVEEFVGRAAAGKPLGIVKEASAEAGEGETDVLTAFLLSNPV